MILDANFQEVDEMLETDFGEVTVLGSGGEGGIVDQTYNPESENAQSGKAVAEAVKNVVRYDENGHLTINKGKFEDLLVRGADSEYEEVATKKELQTQIGNIETALDSIIAIQNNLIGGGSV